MWNLEDLDPKERVELEQEFREGAHIAAIKAEIAQKQAARAFYATKPRSIRGLGHQVAAINPLFYHFWKSQGRSFLDEDWLRWIRQRHDSIRVESGPSKIYSAWTPAVEKSRFHMRYADAQAAA